MELKCDTSNRNDDHPISPAVPRPTVDWLFNGDLVFNGINFDDNFLLKDSNFIFTPGFIFPPFLKTKDDFSLMFDLQAENFTLLTVVDPHISDFNIRGRLFDLILGSWTCVQSNSYGTVNATTKISEHGGIIKTQHCNSFLIHGIIACRDSQF